MEGRGESELRLPRLERILGVQGIRAALSSWQSPVRRRIYRSGGSVPYLGSRAGYSPQLSGNETVVLWDAEKEGRILL